MEESVATESHASEYLKTLVHNEKGTGTWEHYDPPGAPPSIEPRLPLRENNDMNDEFTSSVITRNSSVRGTHSAPEIARQQGMNPVDYLQERGFIQQISDEEGLRGAFDHGPLTSYIGFDPTGPSLHVGHMVSIMMLGSLQRMGHRPIAVGGGGTALVGDPTGRTSSREVIGIEDLERNLTSIMSQLAKYLDFRGNQFTGGNPAAVIVNNADWLLPLEYIPFLRDIGRHFSVNEMLALDTYKSRIEAEHGLNFAEFNYRIVQAYDFLHLFRKEGCTLQMGGSDQWGNIVGGLELIRKTEQARAFALVSPLITTSTGEKMGKTSSGVRVWLDPEQFSPYDYFQYWVNTDDRNVERFLRFFTFLPGEEIADLTSVTGKALREAKSVLAFEATLLAHGVEAAESAARTARQLFNGTTTVTQGNGASSIPITEIPANELHDMFLVDAFIATGLTNSKAETRRLAQQHGLYMEDSMVTDVDRELAPALDGRNTIVLRVGKKRFAKVVISAEIVRSAEVHGS